MSEKTDNTSEKLSALRSKLNEADQRLLEVVAERQRIVAEIGEDKLSSGRGTRDFEREKVVIEGARERARSLGLDSALAASLIQQLIEASLTAQEQARVVAEGSGSGRRVCIIGGSGKMGLWFARFFSSQRYLVTIADPVTPPAEYQHIEDWRDMDADFDVIVVATQLRLASDILAELAVRKPAGLVFDVGSLKTPLRASLQALLEAGVRVTSIHPMFGPDTRLLSDRHLITVDVGHAAAAKEAAQLFDATMVETIAMSLDEHDRLIAYVLGLSHAVNIVFFTALAESAEAAPRLLELSSTTFDAQMAVAKQVASESPSLYFEIQHLNDFGMHPLAALADASDRILQSVQSGDQRAFEKLMDGGASYFGLSNDQSG